MARDKTGSLTFLVSTYIPVMIYPGEKGGKTLQFFPKSESTWTFSFRRRFTERGYETMEPRFR